MVLYKDVIDHVTIEISYNAGDKGYTYLGLKRRLDGYFKTNLSFKTYNNHIQHMLIGRILEKNERLYSLTRECRLEYKSRLERGETIDTKNYKWRRRPIGTNSGEPIRLKSCSTIDQVHNY
jgi:hypothetical protein